MRTKYYWEEVFGIYEVIPMSLGGHLMESSLRCGTVASRFVRRYFITIS